MKDIEYVGINEVNNGDTIILTKYPIGNEFGAKFKVIDQTDMSITMKRLYDGKVVYEFKEHYPKVYKLVEYEYLIWDDYTDEVYNVFDSKEEAEVYLNMLVEEGEQRGYFAQYFLSIRENKK